jgi:hypothetical protein
MSHQHPADFIIGFPPSRSEVGNWTITTGKYEAAARISYNLICFHLKCGDYLH